MKKTILILTGFILSGIVFDACKKGANDPFLSLSSRRARLAGEWKMTKWEATDTQTNASGMDTWVISGDGTTATESNNGVSSPAYAYAISLSMDKKGGFTETMTDASSGTSKTYTDKGQWFFAGKNKELELKNKEAIIFDILSSSDASGTDTYKGISADYIYVIDQLKSKEMIIVTDESGTKANGNSYTTKSTMTFTQ